MLKHRGGGKQNVEDLCNQERRRMLRQSEFRGLRPQGRGFDEAPDHAIVHGENQDRVIICLQRSDVRLKLPPLVVVRVVPQSGCRQHAATHTPVNQARSKKHLQGERAFRVQQEDAAREYCQQKRGGNAVQAISVTPALGERLAGVQQHRRCFSRAAAGKCLHTPAVELYVLSKPSFQWCVGCPSPVQTCCPCAYSTKRSAGSCIRCLLKSWGHHVQPKKLLRVFHESEPCTRHCKGCLC
mmetsp:Transcript_125708/g.367296  ORF Transcript_125708/g.367296 Transcript_125708/m.367296 type:complete len:240 (+) Transcript_125708:526-1245(+)